MDRLEDVCRLDTETWWLFPISYSAENQAFGHKIGKQNGLLQETFLVWGKVLKTPTSKVPRLNGPVRSPDSEVHS